jgi:hypothetical protein
MLQYLTKLHALFFRMKREEEAPPLVGEEEAPPLLVEECLPTKKVRLAGCRKKRTVQILLSDDEVQTQTIVPAKLQPEAVLEVVLPKDPVLEIVLQTETVHVRAEPIPVLEVVLPTESTPAVHV